jgi:hypothetical protein
MKPRTRPLLTSAALALLVLAGCGADKQIKTGTPTPTASIPVGETDDVVIQLAYSGGFVPMGYDFTNQPTLTVLADGTAYTSGVHTEIFPGPWVKPMMVGRIEPAAVQKLLADAKARKLNREVVYKPNDLIADAADTVLSLTIDGKTYRHSANALSMNDTEPDADKAALRAFVTTLEASQPTGSKPAETAQYAVMAVPAAGTDSVEPKPLTMDWPANTGVSLAAGQPCQLVDAAKLAPVLASARENTRFTEGGAAYVVFARQAIPGNAC